MGQFWPFPRTRSLGVVERNSFRFFPADRLARSNGTNGTEKTESIPFYEEVTSEALASWCATMSKLGQFTLRKWTPATRPGAPTGERLQRFSVCTLDMHVTNCA